MKRINLNVNNYLSAYGLIILGCFMMASCIDNDIDNEYSRNKSSIVMTASADEVILDENAPDDVALTVEWSPATDYGNDFITTYQYQMELIGSKEESLKEYEDEGNFKRSYTNKQLQDILVNDFNQFTGTKGEVKFTVTASFEGSHLIVPDMSSVSVKVRTYGDMQFLADKVYMEGTSVGEQRVELSKNANNSNLYVYNGVLSAGKINFPILYGDETNVISPVSGDEEISSEAMNAAVYTSGDAHSWIIPENDTYRVTIDFSQKTVTIVPAGDIIDVDKIYLAGTAVNGLDEAETEVTKTLENDNLYAFRGNLKAGTLYLPILFDGMKSLSIVPESSSHDINDGKSTGFAQANTGTATNTQYWTIPEDGTYRIVVDTDLKTITIYSPKTDLQSKEVSWNNTTIGQNPYKAPITVLWMYGTFNAFARDAGMFTGYQDKYKLTQSLANPRVFVYKGEALPVKSEKDERGNTVKGSMKFCVENHNNNVYAFGSTADAKRNDHNGYIEVTSNAPQKLVEGQGDNRYAYFIIPENINYVKVDIDKLEVVFDTK